MPSSTYYPTSQPTAASGSSTSTPFSFFSKDSTLPEAAPVLALFAVILFIGFLRRNQPPVLNKIFPLLYHAPYVCLIGITWIFSLAYLQEDVSAFPSAFYLFIISKGMIGLVWFGFLLSLDGLSEDLEIDSISSWYAALILVSLIDLPLLKYLPWRETEFTKECRGYPNTYALSLCVYPTIFSYLIQIIGSILQIGKTQAGFTYDIIFLMLSLICLFVSSVDVIFIRLEFYPEEDYLPIAWTKPYTSEDAAAAVAKAGIYGAAGVGKRGSHSFVSKVTPAPPPPAAAAAAIVSVTAATTPVERDIENSHSSNNGNKVEQLIVPKIEKDKEEDEEEEEEEEEENQLKKEKKKNNNKEDSNKEKEKGNNKKGKNNKKNASMISISARFEEDVEEDDKSSDIEAGNKKANNNKKKGDNKKKEKDDDRNKKKDKESKKKGNKSFTAKAAAVTRQAQPVNSSRGGGGGKGGGSSKVDDEIDDDDDDDDDDDFLSLSSMEDDD